MADLDRMLSSLGDDAAYTDEAADRLEAALSLEPSPRAVARRQAGFASLACFALSIVAGASVGAMAETHLFQPRPVAMLPASSPATTAALLFGGEDS